jgi:hypothetical protein
MEERELRAGQGASSERLRRLLDDSRVLGPSGIERIAWGWRRHAADGLAEVDQAAGRAREALREAGREEAWQALEREVRAMTEGHHAASAWQAEAEGAGRTAEDATLHAALALLAEDLVDHSSYRALVKPMSEALPWLLPEEPPDQYREPRM